MKRFTILLLSVLLAASLYAQDVAVPEKTDLVDDFGGGELDLFMGGSGGYSSKYQDNSFVVNVGGGLFYSGDCFALIAEAYMRKDGVYSGTSANTSSGGMGGFYFRMEAGGIAYRNGNFFVRAGRLPNYDYIDSPYSLFINGNGLTSDIFEATYDDGRFMYSTRWIGLNYNSDQVMIAGDGGSDGVYDDDYYYPDRGANLHTFAVRFGDMTFGIQDAIVYVGRYFDWEYFICPIPAYVIQDALRQDGTPWSRSGEENNLIGLFWLWDRPDGWKFNAQWLLDDGNLHWLSADLFPTAQPNKMAWTGGFSKETPIGVFSFYHAGATKYTFEPTYGEAGREYGYTYYPDVVFTLKDTTTAAIPFDTLMLGYRNGENNLAFLGKWINQLAGFDVGASFEFTVSGSKSPCNAWQEESWHTNQGTEFLNEWPLEWKYVLTAGGSRQLGRFFLYANVSLGYVFNELELAAGASTTDGSHDDVEHNEIQIYKPSSTDRFLVGLTIGGSYRLKIK